MQESLRKNSKFEQTAAKYRAAVNLEYVYITWRQIRAIGLFYVCLCFCEFIALLLEIVYTNCRSVLKGKPLSGRQLNILEEEIGSSEV